MTIKDAYPLFLDWGRGERNYARETLAKFQDCFRAWILPTLGEKQIEGVSRLNIIALRKAMVDRGIGISRQYGVLMALKLFFRFAQDILRVNCIDPDREIRLPRRKVPQVQYLTNEEVGRLLQAVNAKSFTGLRLFTLIEVLLGCGLRISEALSLDRMPFEQGKDEIEITGKGGKRRTVFFPVRTLEAVKRFLYYRTDDHPALFVTTGIPRRLSRSDISRSFIRLRKKARIEKAVTPHMLRHTFCTNLLNNGADITFIKELAGHADIQTTARYYLGVDKRELRKVVDRHLDYSPKS